MKMLLPLALAALAACNQSGVVDKDVADTPALDQMVETPGDWASLDPALGQTPGASGMLVKGPIVTDLDAMLGRNAALFRDRMTSKAGPLTEMDGLWVTMTAPGPDAAYLVVDRADHAMEAGWRDAAGWHVERTAAATIPLPPAVAALKAS